MPSGGNSEDYSKERSDNMNNTAATPSSSSLSDNAGDVKVFHPSTRTWLVLMTLAVLTLMVALDGTSISVALPIIAMQLKGTAIEAFWSGTSFLLCSTVFQPNFASFSNIFGRKPMILVSLTLFFVGTLIAGLSNNFTNMLVGRSIQGVGGGGLIALTEIVITDLIPLRERGTYFGIISAMWSVGSVTGPILGGGFSQNVSWRWIFYINFPFIGVGAVLILLFLKLNFVPSSLLSKLRRIDYIGTVLFIGSTTSFLIPVTWGGVMYEWDSWRTLAPLLIGFVGLIVTMIYEYKLAHDPILPIAIFGTRTAIVSYIETTLHGLVLWCGLYYMPLYFETVKEYTPIVAGISLFPMTFTVAPIAAIAGILVTKTGHWRWAVWLGFVLSTLGLGLFTILDVNTSIAAWIFLLLPAGMGLGLLFPALGFAIQASAKPGYMATAVAFFSFFRAFGQAIGVAVGGVIFQNEMRKNLLRYPEFATTAATLSKDAAGLVRVVLAMEDGPEKLHLKEAYTDSLRIVWAVCCALIGVAGLLSTLTESYSLTMVIDSDQTIREKKTISKNPEEELSD
ncbi:MFS multidrug transporter, variant [Blastomyces gilchristii SLH14081]|uniref:MFS multidrug transporter n=1 Tax=Blastomyces gilchristii (strain SLH14081) TaxID=559298 RepID=A0A179UJD5_BLAGS|nr:MFS multidrug transporter [Blastomyces gilchristii SLH14081]XP_031578163.1 MFS multidrug transporter, variant [Blastomyces gilchristii SLH14081]OAT08185.1 MFS multidrug transporter [Blastomyces gilchristii SLH14081]OAT08186.1 MFS multidrug transporter, variant [Blastomyces gilchristii SLH14081]